MSEDSELLGHLMYRLGARLRAEMTLALKPFGLTLNEFVCLRILQETPGLSNADLARMFEVTPQTMNSTLSTLQAESLISRPLKAVRGRSLPATITPAAGRLLRDSARAVRDAESRVLGALDSAERREFRRMLALVAE